jgi:hypothetical protein
MLKRVKQLRTAVSMLSPDEVRRRANKPLSVGLVASTPDAYAEMEEFLLPSFISEPRRAELMQCIYRSGDGHPPRRFDLVLFEQGLPCPENAFTFFRDDPDRTIQEILEERDLLHLPLARNFPLFRKPMVDQLVQSVSRENAMFAVVSGLPNFVPMLLALPFAVGEFASDTVFLTLNQVRMAFMIAAAGGKPVGYGDQKTEVGSILAGALGWRALARELVGKIPFGGGLIPKGAIAFAGTYVIGKGIEHFHDVGVGYTRDQRRNAFESAYERGKSVVETIVSGLRGNTPPVEAAALTEPRP